MTFRTLTILASLVLSAAPMRAADATVAAIPDDFPRFLGFRPTADGCAIAPRLPGDWPSLAITRIHLHDRVLDVSVEGKEIVVKERASSERALRIEAPPEWRVSYRRE